jgi:hypothetical protein
MAMRPTTRGEMTRRAVGRCNESIFVNDRTCASGVNDERRVFVQPRGVLLKGVTPVHTSSARRGLPDAGSTVLVVSHTWSGDLH